MSTESECIFLHPQKKKHENKSSVRVLKKNMEKNAQEFHLVCVHSVECKTAKVFQGKSFKISQLKIGMTKQTTVFLFQWVLPILVSLIFHWTVIMGNQDAVLNHPMIQLSYGSWCFFHPTHPDLTWTETMWIVAAAFVCPKPRDVLERETSLEVEVEHHGEWRDFQLMN